MSTPTPNQGQDGESSGPWQEQLSQYCMTHGLTQPVYHIASDRRGGRTAWSSAVDVHGHTYNARFWYDGKFLDNAKEDAANVALEKIQAARQLLLQQQQQLPGDKDNDGGDGSANWQGYSRQ